MKIKPWKEGVTKGNSNSSDKVSHGIEGRKRHLEGL